MRNLRRISVITEGGKLVGVYVPPAAPTDPRAPVAYIRAGKRQTIREVEAEVPTTLKSRRDIDAFHAAIRRKLKLRR